MKKLTLSTKSGVFKTAIALTTILMLTSCSNDQVDITPNTYEASIMEVFLSGSTSKSDVAGKPANAPGDTPIATIASNAGSFTSLIAALQYVDANEGASLVEMFSTGQDQYTVFAPTDDAFQTLLDSNDEWNALTDIPSATVLAVLQYHVVEGRRAANSVVPKGKNPKTIETLLEGATFQVNKDLSIDAIGNTANIDPMAFNLSASNGIIHVIDAVLLPIASE